MNRINCINTINTSNFGRHSAIVCQTGGIGTRVGSIQGRDARPGGICLTKEGVRMGSEDAQRARARGMWVGMWHCGMVQSVIHTYRTYPSSSKQQSSGGGGGGALGWAGLGRVGLGWVGF